MRTKGLLIGRLECDDTSRGMILRDRTASIRLHLHTDSEYDLKSPPSTLPPPLTRKSLTFRLARLVGKVVEIPRYWIIRESQGSPDNSGCIYVVAKAGRVREFLQRDRKHSSAGVWVGEADAKTGSACRSLVGLRGLLFQKLEITADSKGKSEMPRDKSPKAQRVDLFAHLIGPPTLSGQSLPCVRVFAWHCIACPSRRGRRSEGRSRRENMCACASIRGPLCEDNG
eukprot:1047873-Amorphochlora_amoeboformis.AAC.1